MPKARRAPLNSGWRWRPRNIVQSVRCTGTSAASSPSPSVIRPATLPNSQGRFTPPLILVIFLLSLSLRFSPFPLSFTTFFPQPPSLLADSHLLSLHSFQSSFSTFIWTHILSGTFFRGIDFRPSPISRALLKKGEVIVLYRPLFAGNLFAGVQLSSLSRFFGPVSAVKMRFSALSLVFVAALVTAEHHHLHFHHRREINTTCTTSTTSTSVQGYNPSTPVQGLNPSSTSVQGFNPSKYGFQGTGVVQLEALSTTGIAGAQDKTPTPTLGAASSTTTTTTVESTTTETEYFTVYMTKPRELGVVGSGTGPTAAGSEPTATLPVVGADTGATAAGSEPTATLPVVGADTGATAAGSAQPTTTLTESTTLTRYITVKKQLSASPTTTASPFIGVLADNTGGAINSCVPETVTIALSTVTVSQIVTVPQIVTIALSTVTVVSKFFQRLPFAELTKCRLIRK